MTANEIREAREHAQAIIDSLGECAAVWDGDSAADVAHNVSLTWEGYVRLSDVKVCAPAVVALADALAAAEQRNRELEHGLRSIARTPCRLHPIAGYMYDRNVSQFAKKLLDGSPAAVTAEDAPPTGAA